MFIDRFFGFFSRDVGIDLGTANTLVLVRGKGILIREPSVVARHKKTKKVLAIGTEAKKMMGKTPATIEAMRPLRHGVIADFDATEAMLTYYIKQVHEGPYLIPRIPRPRIAIGIPSGVTEVERRAVQEVALAAGARRAYLIEEPMAAAIGIGLPIGEPQGHLLVDIGGGTTEIALISLGGIVVNKSLRIAGDEMDEAIIAYCRLRHGLLLGEATAEKIKIEIGSAYADVQSKSAKGYSPKEHIAKQVVVRGRDLERGLPRSLKLGVDEIREALAGIINKIIEEIAEIIEETPPELVADILERGIVICGGASQIRGLDKAISERTKMPVWRAEDAMTCVVRGCGRVLEDSRLLEKVKVIGGLR